MLITEYVLTIIIGIFFGCLTGLTPGIHINTISIFIISSSTFFLQYFSPLNLSIFIISLSICHTFVDYIASIFFGAPDEDSFLSILPGHRLLLKGRGYYAAVFTFYGSLTALFVILLFIPIFLYILPTIYPFFKKIMWLILIAVSLFLIFSEKKDKILWTFFIFFLAGFLGIASLNLNIKEPLLPLLTGLFGASNLLISIKQKTKIPKQTIKPLRKIKLSKKSFFRSFLASIIAAPFTAFLPGLGASQAALISKQSLNIQDQREFLFILGAINTIVMGLSFITLYSIQKTRTGAAVAINYLLPNPTFFHLLLIIITILLVGIASFIIAINLSKLTLKIIQKFDYSKISYLILVVLITIILLFSDFTFYGKLISLLILLTSTSLGIFTILIKIKRMHLMGCLLVPTILFYLL